MNKENDGHLTGKGGLPREEPAREREKNAVVSEKTREVLPLSKSPQFAKGKKKL